MRQALAFAATWPALESLALSAWDAFPDALVAHLPEALEGLDLSYTSITNRGLGRLPVGLTRLDLSGTQVTGAGLRALSALSSLRDLKLAGIVGLSARHLQALPASVEVLDLSNCSGPFSEKELGTADCHFGGSNCGLSVPRMMWPPALRELKLTGAHLSLALLYGMPTTLESLDISRCTMWPVPVDMDACLPRLQTLRADGAALHYRAYYAYSKTYVWNLPSGLKSLSLANVPHLANPTDWQLAFLPASITSLDLSLTDIIQGQYSGIRETAGWFDNLPKRLPHLRLLNLTKLWGGANPQCLEVMQESNVRVIFHPPTYQLRPAPPEPAQPAPDPVPREQDPKWVDFVKLCAEEQRRITWHDLPVEDDDHDDCDNKGDQGDAAYDDEQDGNEDDEQGSLLFMGF